MATTIHDYQRWQNSMRHGQSNGHAVENSQNVALVDAYGQPVRLKDSLFNLISGLGTPKDPTFASQYALRILDRNTVEIMYRTDWISKKIVDAPAEDATREWRKWEATQSQIEAIEEIEKRHRIQQKMTQAIIRARLYGGAALVFAIKGQDPAEELDLDKVPKDGIEFVVVMNRYELMAGPRIFDVMSPYYTRPEYYTVATPTYGFIRGERDVSGGTIQRTTEERETPGRVTARGVSGQQGDPLPVGHSDPRRQMTPAAGTVQIHPSRVIEFVGNELPDWRLVPLGGSWGDSILQAVDDVLKDIGLVLGGIANMINDAKIDVVKIPDFSKQISSQEFANKVLARFSYANQAKSSVNSILLDTEEEWDRVQTRFQGLPDILHEYMVLAGGAADIPMSRLIGQTGGRGMSAGQRSSGGEAGGNVDLRNYYDRIAQKQRNVYRPAMMTLDRCIVMSAIGRFDPTIDYEWQPLWQTDDATKAQIAVQKAQATKTDVETGLINEDALRRARINQLVQDDWYPGLDDAIDEFGAEPEEPDVTVPWSRLAGAMAQMAGQPPASQPSGQPPSRLPAKSPPTGGEAMPKPAGAEPPNLPELAGKPAFRVQLPGRPKGGK